MNKKSIIVSLIASALCGATSHAQILPKPLNNSPVQVVPQPRTAINVMAVSAISTRKLYPLNDTGIPSTACYKPGGWQQLGHIQVSCADSLATDVSKYQDGMIGRDVWASDSSDGKLGFSFTKLNAAGQPLPANAQTWSCVKDNITGLVWEAKTDDGSLHDKSKVFKINDWPGDNISELINASNTQQLCGFNDWRLPTLFELIGIANFGANPTPLVDTNYFNFKPAQYWTNTSSNAPVLHYSFDFHYGQAFSGTNIAAKLPVVLVRANPPAPIDRFRISNDGSEVTDNLYGLIWKRCVEGTKWNGSTCVGSVKKFQHYEAFLEANKNPGWRLPNVKEAHTLYDKGALIPAIVDAAIFPNSGDEPWSSTHWGPNPGWVVSATTGWRFRDESWVPGRGAFPLRLVREIPNARVAPNQ